MPRRIKTFFSNCGLIMTQKTRMLGAVYTAAVLSFQSFNNIQTVQLSNNLHTRDQTNYFLQYEHHVFTCRKISYLTQKRVQQNKEEDEQILLLENSLRRTSPVLCFTHNTTLNKNDPLKICGIGPKSVAIEPNITDLSISVEFE